MNLALPEPLSLYGPPRSERFLTRTLSPGFKVLKCALWSCNDFPLRANERSFLAAGVYASDIADFHFVTWVLWLPFTDSIEVPRIISIGKRGDHPNKRKDMLYPTGSTRCTIVCMYNLWMYSYHLPFHSSGRILSIANRVKSWSGLIQFSSLSFYLLVYFPQKDNDYEWNFLNDEWQGNL